MISKKTILEQFIEGNTEKAIKMLLLLTEKYDKDIYNSAIMLSSRHKSLQRDQNNGIIAPADYNMNENRIKYSLNQTLEDVDDSWTIEDTLPKSKPNLEDSIKSKTNVEGAKEKKKKLILVLAANPTDKQQLRLGEEVREIEEGMRRSAKREDFEIESKWAVRIDDLKRALLDESPTFIHFSGHGSPEGRIIVEDNNGVGKEIPPKAIGNLFELFSDDIHCVILNACYSESQAQEISKHIPYVIGMNDAIPDDAAIKFSTAFYDAIGNGRDVEFAFKYARISIELYDLNATEIPVLIKKEEL